MLSRSRDRDEPRDSDSDPELESESELDPELESELEPESESEPESELDEPELDAEWDEFLYVYDQLMLAGTGGQIAPFALLARWLSVLATPLFSSCLFLLL